MSVPILFRDTSRTPPLPGYSSDPENHSFFSVDPFSKPITGIKKKSMNTAASRTFISSESTDTSYLSSSHLSFSSSEFCDKDHACKCSPIKRESIDSSITFYSENPTLKNEPFNDASNVGSEVSHHVTSEEEVSSVHSTTSTIQMSSFVTVASTPIKEKKSFVSTKTNENSFNHERIAAGLDQRSTFMIRNIPNKYTQVNCEMLRFFFLCVQKTLILRISIANAY